MKFKILLAVSLQLASAARAQYPVERPARSRPAPAESTHTVYPERQKQIIRGLGFELQCDSIGSFNSGMPESNLSVPHDLAPEERQRLYREMFRGFRYCRLAGGVF